MTSFDKQLNIHDELSGVLSRIFKKSELKRLSGITTDIKSFDLGLDRFHNNLRCNIDNVITYTENKIAIDEYVDLLLALAQICVSHGENEIGKDLLDKIISISKKKSSFKIAAGYSYLKLAEIESIQAKWQTAQDFTNKSKRLFKTENYKNGTAECDNLLGTIYAEKGSLKLAKNYFVKAYAGVKNKRNNKTKSKIEVNLGIIYNLIGNYYEAEKYYLKALTTFGRLNERKRIAEIKHNLGMMYINMKEYKLALAEFKNSLKISNSEHYYPIKGITYLGIADVHQKIGKYNVAMDNADKGLQVCFRINDRLTVADIYKVKAVIYKNMDRLEAAESYFLTSLRINKELENELNTAESAFELGLLYKDMGSNKEAREYFKSALKYYKKFDNKGEIKKIQEHLAILKK